MKSDSIKTYSYRVSQASKSDLIVILYDIAMESVQDAQAAYREKNDDEYHASLPSSHTSQPRPQAPNVGDSQLSSTKRIS